MEKEEKENQEKASESSNVKEEVLDLSSDSLWEIGDTGSTTGGEIRFAEDIDEYDRSKPIKKSAADSRPAKSRRTKR